VRDSAEVAAQDPQGARSSSPRHIEQLALIIPALLFGLVGLAVHASVFGNRLGVKGLISEVTHEVVTVVKEIKGGSSDQGTTDMKAAIPAAKSEIKTA
jgi:hypothetical protein